MSHVDAFVLAPSQDLGELARSYVQHLPRAARLMLRGFGSSQGTGANLPSYLLFDRGYCRRLLALGYADALVDEVVAIIDGHDTRPDALSLKDEMVKEDERMWRL